MNPADPITVDRVCGSCPDADGLADGGSLEAGNQRGARVDLAQHVEVAHAHDKEGER